MPIQIADTGIRIEQHLIKFGDFTQLVDRHLHAYPSTSELELEGAQVRTQGFPDEQLCDFIQHVCRWGGYAGIAARVLAQNNVVDVRARFHDAVTSLEQNEPDLESALQAINSVRQLGTPAFASKHLRFLRPDICPVLDSINSTRLAYEFNPSGFAALARDCLAVAQILQQHGISNPMQREMGRWFVADVEMALFAHLLEL
ncbi:MAG: hypothetical protein HY872_06145 [Chloroflexi bacterium]|nr:hypothetical protein [Chloroflexota bacterium]